MKRLIGLQEKTLAVLLLILILGYGLNFIWEYLHYPLYECKVPLGKCAFVSAFRDALIILGMALAGILLFKEKFWFLDLKTDKLVLLIVVSFFVGYIIELQGLYFGKWEYSNLMPIIPMLGVGLSPILQMLILPALTFYLAKRFLRS